MHSHDNASSHNGVWKNSQQSAREDSNISDKNGDFRNSAKWTKNWK